ncbi:hypothetical protein JCM11251_001990 [Rhodosporidiobolus azoricus]
MPPDPSSASAVPRARDAAAPYPNPSGGGSSAQSAAGDGGEGGSGGKGNGSDGKERGNPANVGERRHLSCENCRIRKMKCSRTSPCLSCRMRGDECVWIGQAPNGSADEDELEQSTAEVAHLKRLVDLLLARLEEQDAQGGGATAASATDESCSHRPSPPGGPGSAGGVVLPGAGSPLSEPRNLPRPPSSLPAAAGPPSARDIPVHPGGPPPPPSSGHPYSHHSRYPHPSGYGPGSGYGYHAPYGPPGGPGGILDPYDATGYGIPVPPHHMYGGVGRPPSAYRGEPYGPPLPGREYWGP